MQSRTFSKLSTTIIVIITLMVIVYGVSQSLSVVKPPTNLIPDEIIQSFSITTRGSDIFQNIKAPNGTIQAIVASTTINIVRGLSGRESLAEDSGMIFVFPESGSYGFWMKDMKFPIDIVWINQEKVVIGVISQLSPKTFPTVFYPPAPISYVLELRTGGSLDYGIATGTKLVF